MRRELDSVRVKNYLLANGMSPAKSLEDADYIFFFTCDQLKSIEDSCIDAIKEFKKYRGHLIVCGCLPLMNKKRLGSVFDGVVLPTKELHKIDGLFPEFKIKFNQLPDANTLPKLYETVIPSKRKSIKSILIKVFRNTRILLTKLDKFKFRVIRSIPKVIKKYSKRKIVPLIAPSRNAPSLRISWGCLGNCSYCNIKKAIGELKSKPPETVLDEVKRVVAQKKYAFAILSSDAGSYGRDIDTTLPKLLKRILEEDERVRIEFIQDLHANWLCHYLSEFVELIKTKRIESILVPVQSGSERVLNLMNRGTKLNELKKALKELKAANPKLLVRTQIIVGFPTETEEDFMDTVKLISECDFDEVDLFPYHETETMPSARIKPKVASEVIEERVERFKKLVPQEIMVH